MPILYYHAESDCLFVEQYQFIDWPRRDAAHCEEVSDQPWAVERYNQENPGYPVHLYVSARTCGCKGETHCPICDGGLGFCLICRAGECELTTDCPGEPQVDIRRNMVCAGLLDYWSGVWL